MNEGAEDPSTRRPWGPKTAEPGYDGREGGDWAVQPTAARAATGRWREAAIRRRPRIAEFHSSKRPKQTARATLEARRRSTYGARAPRLRSAL